VGLELSELASWEGSCHFSAATNFSARWTDGDVTGLASQRDTQALLKIFDLLLCIASKRLLRRVQVIIVLVKALEVLQLTRKAYLLRVGSILLPRPQKAIRCAFTN
jgi:hypothetical protein